VYPIVLGHVEIGVAGVEILDENTHAAGIARVQQLLVSWALIECLEFAQRVDEIIGKRRGVGRVLLDLLPTNRRGARWRDEKVLLDGRWFKIARVWNPRVFPPRDEGVRISAINTQNDLSAVVVVDDGGIALLLGDFRRVLELIDDDDASEAL